MSSTSPSSSGLFPYTPLFALFISDVNSAPADALPRLLTPLLASVGKQRDDTPFFDAVEETALTVLLGFAQDSTSAFSSGANGSLSPIARTRRLAEGALYTFEAAAHANAKTAALGSALLAAGMTETSAVAFGNVWAAGSAAVVVRLRARPFAPLVLTSSSVRVSLGIGSSASTGGREARATLDLALTGSAVGGGGGKLQDQVVSLELSAVEVGALLERLDAIQAQVDSLA